MRTIGAHGPSVGPVGLGAMGMSWGYADTSSDDPVDVINRAIDLGATLIDTADIYGPFTNEELVGRAIASRRSEVSVATKCGLVVRDAATFDQVNDGTPEHVRAACEASLGRLGVDAIDVFYLHRVDPDVPVEESVGAMAELVAAGKVRAIGLCECDVETLERANGIHPISAVQSELSLWTRGALEEVVPWCEQHDAAFVPYAPLGRGFLTGAVKSLDDVPVGDVRRQQARFQPDALAANQALVDEVRAIAGASGCTPAQVALAWLLSCSDVVIPIPGMKRLFEVEENLAAAEIVLTDAQRDGLARLRPAAGDTGRFQAPSTGGAAR
jgi:aryl-alcohol dehydrogenase-like predicted oxidoreductase